VRPNDETEFAKAIVRLMEDPARRSKMGEYGRIRVRCELNWNITSQNLLRAYSRLFEKAPHQRAGAARLA